MEATVMNVLSPKDKAIVVNGGSFGHRFVELLQLHQIPHHEINLDYGQPLTEAHLAPLANNNGGPYFNSGVILINIDFWRKVRLFMGTSELGFSARR